MENKKMELDELSQKVLLGLKKALRKLAQTYAANNKSLVVNINGEIKKVPAKELLATLPD